MLKIRPANERGYFDHGWLKTHHTFSFADYYHPSHVSFRSLRVMNEDWVAGGRGFGMHPHRDMEILTYVLEGELQHKDSLGNSSVIHAGELQQMTAGLGILHSEFNPSPSQPVHLYQIWLMPNQKGLTPSYSQKRFDPHARKNRWQLVASPDDVNSLPIHQDAKVFLANLDRDAVLTYSLDPKRSAWIQVLRGGIQVNELKLHAGDGIAASEESLLRLQANDDAEILLFDLA